MAIHTAADFKLTTSSQLVLCFPEDRRILKNPHSLGPRAPARGPRGAPPAVSSSSLLLPPFRFRFRSFIYGPPCGDVHEEAPSRIVLFTHGELGISKHKKSPGWERMGNQNQPGLTPRGLYRPVAKPPTDSKRVGAMRDFGEHHQGEVRRISLPRTQVNKDKSKGWAQEKPTSNSVGKGEGAAQNIDPPYQYHSEQR